MAEIRIFMISCFDAHHWMLRSSIVLEEK